MQVSDSHRGSAGVFDQDFEVLSYLSENKSSLQFTYECPLNTVFMYCKM